MINTEGVLHKIEEEDGDDVYYLEETNEFVIVSTDGYIRNLLSDCFLYFYQNLFLKYLKYHPNEIHTLRKLPVLQAKLMYLKFYSISLNGTFLEEQCGKTFQLSDSELEFYKSKNLELPKRCKLFFYPDL